MNILIVAAHPDDEVLGCGGSIRKWSQSNHNVHILILAEGITSRDLKRNRKEKKVELNDLFQCAQKAGDILGAKSVNVLNYPDNRMDSLDLLDVIKTIENYVEKINPEMIVTHHIGDLNIDHQIVNQAVITASRPHTKNNVSTILTFEVPSSTEWQSPTSNVPFNPNWYEDISNEIDYKIEALNIYGSEMREWPHARSIKAINHLASLRGSSVGVDSAEAFMLIREIRK